MQAPLFTLTAVLVTCIRRLSLISYEKNIFHFIIYIYMQRIFKSLCRPVDFYHDAANLTFPGSLEKAASKIFLISVVCTAFEPVATLLDGSLPTY